MYTGLVHAHSGFRYLVLLLVAVAVIKATVGFFGKKEFTGVDNKLALWALIITHVQFLLGIVLYFISPIVKTALSDMGAAMKDATLRFWAVEHVTIMVLAVVAITLGRVLSKKASSDSAKHLRILVFYLVGLILLMVGIPWLAR